MNESNICQNRRSATRRYLRIGIMGGTFNPIHYGHLLAAQEAWQRFELDKVIFVPSAQPPHKQKPDVCAKHRYKMIQMAINNNEHFIISDIEITRKGMSYSEDTIRAFKEIYGDENRLYFIIGADAIAELNTWKNVENLPSLCQFIAVNRPGYQLSIEKRWLSCTHLLEIPEVNISSTQIRQRIKEGKSIRYLIPQEVERYIEEHSLYKA